jgi:RNA polymerase sigma-70 factor (ECF subfamily)
VAQRLAIDDVDLMRDQALVERAQEGDLDAFSELYTRYFRRLVRFSAKRVGDFHEAEEIAQEAFARAYRALPTFAGERRFYPWLSVIASRLCIDALRRRGRVEVGEIGEGEFVDAGFERLDAEGDLATLTVAMGNLSGRHREVLELREREGWSYQHIADHYHVSLGTVEALLWRARRALRREFMALCSALAAIPVVRRVAYSSQNAPGSAFAALGCVGAVVALSVGMSVPQPARDSRVPTARIVSVVAAAGPLLAQPDPVPQPQPAGLPATRAGSSAAHLPAAPSHPTGVAAPAPSPHALQTRIMSHDAAATAARGEPVEIGVGRGPVVGLNPGIPIPPVKINLGRQP